MQLNAKLVFLFIILFSFGACCAQIDTNRFSETIEDFKYYRSQVSELKHLWKVDAARVGGEFDVSRYFDIFSSVRVPNGRELDWVYSFDEHSGYPVLYLRSVTATPFSTHDELRRFVWEEAELEKVERAWGEYQAKLKALPKVSMEPIDPFADDDPFGGGGSNDPRDQLYQEYQAALAELPRRHYRDWWLEELVVENDSDHGFLELAVLTLVGNQFGLYWHANFDDLEIIPDRATLLEILERSPEEVYGVNNVFLEPKDKKRALALDTTPSVVREEGGVTVKLLAFTKWGGFVRTLVRFDRDEDGRRKISTDLVFEVEFFTGLTY